MDQINQPNGIRDLSSNFRSTAPPFTMKNTEQLNNMSKEQYIPSRRMSPEKVKISIKWSWKSKLFFGFLIVLMASLTAVTIYMYVRPLNGMNSSPLSSTSPKPQELIIYTKEDWGGKPWDSNVRLNYLNTPLNRSIISHTVMKNCYTKVKISNAVLATYKNFTQKSYFTIHRWAVSHLVNLMVPLKLWLNIFNRNAAVKICVSYKNTT